MSLTRTPWKQTNPSNLQSKFLLLEIHLLKKSSLTAALKKKLSGVVRFFTSGNVSGVDQKTVGIVPDEVESDIYNRVILQATENFIVVTLLFFRLL